LPEVLITVVNQQTTYVTLYIVASYLFLTVNKKLLIKHYFTKI